MVRLRACEIFKNSALTLIAIESVDFWHSGTRTGDYAYGTIEPIAVIVCSRDGITAIDMEAKPANFDELRGDIPELDSLITPFAKSSS